ncbi:TPA: hypothetical protein DIC40_05030 [Patescibacteria group bacterium]|nr:hypothetical protein [Candidatus Gracilibacteria bacterium]
MVDLLMKTENLVVKVVNLVVEMDDLMRVDDLVRVEGEAQWRNLCLPLILLPLQQDSLVVFDIFNLLR